MPSANPEQQQPDTNTPAKSPLGSSALPLEFLQALVASSQDAIGMADNTHTVILANRSFEQMCGYGSAAVGMKTYEFFSVAWQAYLQQEVIHTVSLQGAWQGTLIYQRPDGSERPAHTSVFQVRDSQQNLLGTAIILRDVTDQMEFARFAEEGDVYLRAMFLAMRDLVLVINEDGYYMDAPQTSTTTTDQVAVNLLGKHIGDEMPEALAQEFLRLIQYVLRTGMTEEVTYMVSTLKDEEAWFHATVSPLTRDRVVWVARNITVQHRAEEERQRLQEELIHHQQEMLRQLSTPLIPLTDDLLVMPLVGMIDNSRAEQIIEALLEGVASSRAHTTIIDITGVPVVDSQIANALLRAAHAVKLLGARVIITGIRPEVAQTLVGLGIDLEGITTYSTLQMGIAAAFARRKQRL